jgi:hypothetical protein
MNHLANCHGEWTMLAASAGYISFAIVWVKLMWQTFKVGKTNDC